METHISSSPIRLKLALETFLVEWKQLAQNLKEEQEKPLKPS